MNKTIVSLLMTFTLFICSLSLTAQKDFQQDTTYYERFPDKTCPQSGATPESSASVQLDRSPAGAGKLLPSV
jgi:hypothetical protein